ncbi:hypothetical protein, partial [uncultured Duncaniella sp.]|uniref:hypothetical protein n=1 Tax=uncultured Duncaniella sp. TaxID=2768039 RepID=UPI0025B339BD
TPLSDASGIPITPPLTVGPDTLSHHPTYIGRMAGISNYPLFPIMEERFLLTDIPMSDGWLIPSALQIKGDFFDFQPSCRAPDITCHRMSSRCI